MQAQAETSRRTVLTTGLKTTAKSALGACPRLSCATNALDAFLAVPKSTAALVVVADPSVASLVGIVASALTDTRKAVPETAIEDTPRLAIAVCQRTVVGPATGTARRPCPAPTGPRLQTDALITLAARLRSWIVDTCGRPCRSPTSRIFAVRRHRRGPALFGPLKSHTAAVLATIATTARKVSRETSLAGL